MGCLRVCTYLAVVAAVAVGAALYLLPRYTDLDGMAPMLTTERNFAYADMPDLRGKVAVVTGANTGLGFDSAKGLAAAGATTVMACRTVSKCTAAAARILEVHPDARVVTRALDLSSLASVRAFADGLAAGEEEGGVAQIDMLMLNAGVMVPPHTLTADGLELQFGVNHVSHAYLTLKLLPLVRRAAAQARGRGGDALGGATVTVVSSIGHVAPVSAVPAGVYLDEAQLNDKDNYSPFEYYGQSKLANVLFSNELSRRLGGGAEGIFVNAVHPGGVATDLIRHLQDAIRKFAGDWLAEAVPAAVGFFSWTPEEGALTQLYTAASPQVAARQITGKYFHPLAKEHRPSAQAADAGTAAKLWDFTAQILADRGFTDYTVV